MDLRNQVAQTRDGIVGVLRISPTAVPAQFKIWIVGTAFCVVADRYYVTAYHIFNDGKARQAPDGFYLLFAPNNGAVLHYVEVQAFRHEDRAADMAILDAPTPQPAAFHTKALPVAFSAVDDGAPVMTFGCPAPIVHAVNVAGNGKLVAIQTQLITHANEGIVAAQSPAGEHYELNVSWHIGESGGPIIQVDPLGAFALMQFYRNIQAPHGVLPGPHVGRALRAMEVQLRSIGATVV